MNISALVAGTGLGPGLAAALLLGGLVPPLFALGADSSDPGLAVSAAPGAEAGGGFLCGCVEVRTSRSMLRPEGRATGLGPSALGEKRLLVYRIDFSDVVGAAITSNAAVDLVAGLNGFYRDMSYGQMGFAAVGAGSVVTETLRLPEPAAAYDTNFDKIMAVTRETAAAAGYTISTFDHDIVCTGTKPWLPFGAMAYVGGPGVWLANSNFTVGVAGHELGHNLGLPHASAWFTSEQSVVGPGSVVEYGDPFDCMGVPGGSTSHFNVRFKYLLGWISDPDAPWAESGTVYHLTAQDQPSARGVRALRLQRNGFQEYWLEFRQSFPNNRYVTNGVTLRWAGAPSENTLLLDARPGTTSGTRDAPVIIGRTFWDVCADLYITPLRKTDATPEVLDLVVQRGPFPGNRSPVLTLTASATNAALDETLFFQAAATDPDGDELAYSWDFGDGGVAGNDPVAAHAWAFVGGAYPVHCTATDMKGGTASANVMVVVGTVTPRYLTGRVLCQGIPLEGVQVKATGSRASYTDSAGGYCLAWTAPGRYTLSAFQDGWLCYNADFENPVSVSSNLAGFDFAAVPVSLGSVTLIATGSVWKYLDTGSSPGPDWTSPTYDDSAWPAGPAKLGYGVGDEATTVRYGPESTNRYITTWFRHPFDVTEVAAVNHLLFSLRRDDGAVVYLNGQEVYRENLPPGPVQPDTTALVDVNSSEEKSFFKRLPPGVTLVNGRNLLAVELHQFSSASTDLGFDFELIALSDDPAYFTPGMTMARAESEVVLRWPAAYADWSVRATDRLPRTSAWRDVLAPVVQEDGWALLFFSPTNQTGFFQLQKTGWCGPWWP